MNKRSRFKVSDGGLLVLIFIIDRIVKWYALVVLSRDGYFLIPGATGFILEQNQRVAYNIYLPPPLLVLLMISMIVLLVWLFILANRRGERWIAVAFGMIIIGAVSNLLDRIQHGFVVDMIVLTSWPVFNLADVYILVGVVWVAWLIFHLRKSIAPPPRI